MTVGDFFVHTTGARQFSFSEDAPSMCGQDFWHKYRGKSEWNAEIDTVRLIPRRDIGTGDGVICLITLKKN